VDERLGGHAVATAGDAGSERRHAGDAGQVAVAVGVSVGVAVGVAVAVAVASKVDGFFAPESFFISAMLPP
jgi:hypothetical protein